MLLMRPRPDRNRRGHSQAGVRLDPESEQNHDPARKGAAMIIEIDRMQGYPPAARRRMARRLEQAEDCDERPRRTTAKCSRSRPRSSIFSRATACRCGAIYRRADGALPAMVDAHGGAWIREAVNNDPINRPIAAGGIMVMAIDYSLPPAGTYRPRSPT
jgi:acetyl esterase/lipase